MNDAIVVALITGACAIVSQLIISAKSTNDLYAKMDKHSELKDAELKGDIAVIRTEITELRKNVEKHNSVIERTYALEKEVAKQGEQIKTLFNKE